MGDVKDPVDIKCIEDTIATFRAYDEKALYQYWVDTTSSVPFTSKQKAEKHKKFNKRLVVVGKYRMLFFKKGGITNRNARTLQKVVHLYDILEFSATDNTQIVEMKYNDKEKGAEPVSMRIKADNIPLFIKTIRTSYRSITIGFPEHSLIKFTYFYANQLAEFDSELEVGPANGFLETYMAQCSYYRTRPSIELSRYIRYLVQAGITDLDLSTCPGVEPKSEISFDLPTVFATLAHNTYFTALIVKDIQARGVMDALGLALQHNRVIRRVHFTNTQEEQSLTQIGQALKLNPYNVVEILDLSGNNLTAESVPAFCSGLGYVAHGITVLDLSRCNLNPKGIQALFQCFQANFGVSLSIRELNLSYNRFDEIGTAAITNWLNLSKGYYALRKLWLEATNIDFVALGPILRTINNLTSISLAHNKFEKPDVIAELRTFIECSIHLTELDLSACHFTPETLEEILIQLGKNHQLQPSSLKLKLAENNLGPRGALTLARTLVVSPYLYSLDISQNKLRGKGIAEVLESLNHNQGIAELYLGKNLGSSSDGDELIKPLTDYVTSHPALMTLGLEAGNGSSPFGRSLLPLLQAIGNNTTSIITLDISGNAIGDYGASILTDVLASNTTLTTLNTDRNNISLVGWQALVFAFTTNRTLRHFTYPISDIEKASLPEKKKDLLRDTVAKIMRYVDFNAATPNPPALPFGDLDSTYVTPANLTPLAHVPAHLKDLPPPSQDLVLEKLHSPASSPAGASMYDGASTRDRSGSLSSTSSTPSSVYSMSPMTPPPASLNTPPLGAPPPSLSPPPSAPPLSAPPPALYPPLGAPPPSLSTPGYSNGYEAPPPAPSVYGAPPAFGAPPPSAPPPLAAPPPLYPPMSAPPPTLSMPPPPLSSPPPPLSAPPPTLSMPPPTLSAPPPAQDEY